MRYYRIHTDPASKLRLFAPRLFDTDHFGGRFRDFPVPAKGARRGGNNDRSGTRCPTNPGTTAFDGTAYLDRADPRLAMAKFLELAFTRGPFIELAPGSKCPDMIFWSGRSAFASRFLIFCAALAFALWRALALVMSFAPFTSFSGQAVPRYKRGIPALPYKERPSIRPNS